MYGSHGLIPHRLSSENWALPLVRAYTTSILKDICSTARGDCDPGNWPQGNSSASPLIQFPRNSGRIVCRTRPHPYLAHYTSRTACIIVTGLCHYLCFPSPIEFQAATGVSMISLSEPTLFRTRIYLITNIGYCMKAIWYWLHPDDFHIKFEDDRRRDYDR